MIDIQLRALPGSAIVWFLPYQRNGVIEIPDDRKEQSVEAIIVHDNTGYGLPVGAKVLVSRTTGDGQYFPVGDKTFCRVRRAGLYLIEDREAA